MQEPAKQAGEHVIAAFEGFEEGRQDHILVPALFDLGSEVGEEGDVVGFVS